jgi:hypothetical protein
MRCAGLTATQGVTPNGDGKAHHSGGAERLSRPSPLVAVVTRGKARVTVVPPTDVFAATRPSWPKRNRFADLGTQDGGGHERCHCYAAVPRRNGERSENASKSGSRWRDWAHPRSTPLPAPTRRPESVAGFSWSSPSRLSAAALRRKGSRLVVWMARKSRRALVMAPNVTTTKWH